MNNITAAQKRQLRSKTHGLKPVVIVGSKGITESVLQEIDRALFDHELIKVRIHIADKVQRKQIAQTICDHAQAALIQTIGHIIVIYRKRPKYRKIIK